MPPLYSDYFYDTNPIFIPLWLVLQEERGGAGGNFPRPSEQDRSEAMPYYERRIRSGRVLEVFRYFSLRRPGANIPRGKNQKKSSADQLVRNYANAKKNLTRIVNTNFGPGDLYITLTYEEPQPSPARAKLDLAKYLRRVRKKEKKCFP